MTLQNHSVLFKTDFTILPTVKRTYGRFIGVDVYNENPWIKNLIDSGKIIPLKHTGRWINDPMSIPSNIYVEDLEFVLPIHDDFWTAADVVNQVNPMDVMFAEFITVAPDGAVKYVAGRYGVNYTYLTPVLKEVISEPYTFTGEGGSNLAPELEDEGVLAIRIYPQDYIVDGELVPINIQANTLMTKADISIREGVAAWFVYHRATKQWLYGNSGKEVIERYEEVTLNGNLAQDDISGVIARIFADIADNVVNGFTYDVVNYFIHRKLYGVASYSVMLSILSGSMASLSTALVNAWLLAEIPASDEELNTIIASHV